MTLVSIAMAWLPNHWELTVNARGGGCMHVHGIRWENNFTSLNANSHNILGFNTDYCAEAVMNGINCQLEQRCIPYSYQCDGTPDCGVRSSAFDETNCHRQYHR